MARLTPTHPLMTQMVATMVIDLIGSCFLNSFAMWNCGWRVLVSLAAISQTFWRDEDGSYHPAGWGLPKNGRAVVNDSILHEVAM